MSSDTPNNNINIRSSAHMTILSNNNAIPTSSSTMASSPVMIQPSNLTQFPVALPTTPALPHAWSGVIDLEALNASYNTTSSQSHSHSQTQSLLQIKQEASTSSLPVAGSSLLGYNPSYDPMNQHDPSLAYPSSHFQQPLIHPRPYNATLFQLPPHQRSQSPKPNILNHNNRSKPPPPRLRLQKMRSLDQLSARTCSPLATTSTTSGFTDFLLEESEDESQSESRSNSNSSSINSEDYGPWTSRTPPTMTNDNDNGNGTYERYQRRMCTSRGPSSQHSRLKRQGSLPIGIGSGLVQGMNGSGIEHYNQRSVGNNGFGGNDGINGINGIMGIGMGRSYSAPTQPQSPSRLRHSQSLSPVLEFDTTSSTNSRSRSPDPQTQTRSSYTFKGLCECEACRIHRIQFGTSIGANCLGVKIFDLRYGIGIDAGVGLLRSNHNGYNGGEDRNSISRRSSPRGKLGAKSTPRGSPRNGARPGRNRDLRLIALNGEIRRSREEVESRGSVGARVGMITGGSGDQSGSGSTTTPNGLDIFNNGLAMDASTSMNASTSSSGNQFDQSAGYLNLNRGQQDVSSPVNENKNLMEVKMEGEPSLESGVGQQGLVGTSTDTTPFPTPDLNTQTLPYFGINNDQTYPCFPQRLHTQKPNQEFRKAYKYDGLNGFRDGSPIAMDLTTPDIDPGVLVERDGLDAGIEQGGEVVEIGDEGDEVREELLNRYTRSEKSALLSPSPGPPTLVDPSYTQAQSLETDDEEMELNEGDWDILRSIHEVDLSHEKPTAPRSFTNYHGVFGKRGEFYQYQVLPPVAESGDGPGESQQLLQIEVAAYNNRMDQGTTRKAQLLFTRVESSAFAFVGSYGDLGLENINQPPQLSALRDLLHGFASSLDPFSVVQLHPEQSAVITDWVLDQRSIWNQDNWGGVGSVGWQSYYEIPLVDKRIVVEINDKSGDFGGHYDNQYDVCGSIGVSGATGDWCGDVMEGENLNGEDMSLNFRRVSKTSSAFRFGHERFGQICLPSMMLEPLSHFRHSEPFSEFEPCPRNQPLNSHFVEPLDPALVPVVPASVVVRSPQPSRLGGGITIRGIGRAAVLDPENGESNEVPWADLTRGLSVSPPIWSPVIPFGENDLASALGDDRSQEVPNSEIDMTTPRDTPVRSRSVDSRGSHINTPPPATYYINGKVALPHSSRETMSSLTGRQPFDSTTDRQEGSEEENTGRNQCLACNARSFSDQVRNRDEVAAERFDCPWVSDSPSKVFRVSGRCKCEE